MKFLPLILLLQSEGLFSWPLTNSAQKINFKVMFIYTSSLCA